MNKEIKTEFGSIRSEVHLFPIYYLVLVFALPVILPFEIVGENTIFNLWANSEGLSEIFQFIFYFGAFLFSLKILIIKKFKFLMGRNFLWFSSALFLLIISYEEISFITTYLPENFLASLRDSNLQNEVNMHNTPFFSTHGLPITILFILFLGYFGWKFFPKLDVFPSKEFSLYFLFYALMTTFHLTKPKEA